MVMVTRAWMDGHAIDAILVLIHVASSFAKNYIALME